MRLSMGIVSLFCLPAEFSPGRYDHNRFFMHLCQVDRLLDIQHRVTISADTIKSIISCVPVICKFLIIQRSTNPVNIGVVWIKTVHVYPCCPAEVRRKYQCCFRRMGSCQLRNVVIRTFEILRRCHITPNIHFAANTDKYRTAQSAQILKIFDQFRIICAIHNGLAVCGEALNGKISFNKDIIKTMVKDMAGGNIFVDTTVTKNNQFVLLFRPFDNIFFTLADCKSADIVKDGKITLHLKDDVTRRIAEQILLSSGISADGLHITKINRAVTYIQLDENGKPVLDEEGKKKKKGDK